MSTTPVILLAHGSRNVHADSVIEQIARAAEQHSSISGGRLVVTAHLDFSPDTLTSAAHFLADFGYPEAIVVPLLFTRAFHMRYDVPEAVAEAEQAAGIALRVADGIGTEDDLAELVASHALRHVPAGVRPTQLALYSVGSSVPGANATVADCADRIARILTARLGNPVSAKAFVATGPQADEQQFHSFITPSTIVQPLFVAPGTLWDKQRCRMPQQCVRSTPLGVALAPLVLARADRALADFAPALIGTPAHI